MRTDFCCRPQTKTVCFVESRAKVVRDYARSTRRDTLVAKPSDDNVAWLDFIASQRRREVVHRNESLVFVVEPVDVDVVQPDHTCP